jgi:probable rRNA maturation factor
MEMNSIEVDVLNEQDDLEIDAAKVMAVVQEVIHFEGEDCHEVAVHFVDKERICELHALFFDDPSLTDCITLPIDEEEDAVYRHLGEVFVCPFTAKQYIKESGGSVQDEVLLYLVHGLLHLMGYDDMEEEDRLAMRAAEARHLRHLKENGLCL